jgi:hypothetical protein
MAKHFEGFAKVAADGDNTEPKTFRVPVPEGGRMPSAQEVIDAFLVEIDGKPGDMTLRRSQVLFDDVQMVETMRRGVGVVVLTCDTSCENFS